MDPHHFDEGRPEPSEGRESPMFVPQENEGGSPDTSDGSESTTSAPAMQDPADQEGPDINPNADASEVDDRDDGQWEFEEQSSDEQDGEKDGEQGEQEDNDEYTAGKGGSGQRFFGGHCSDACKERHLMMTERIEKKDITIATKDTMIEKLKDMIRRYEKQLRDNGIVPDGKPGRPQDRPKRDGGSRSKTPTWPNMVRLSIKGLLPYDKAWKQSQRELNMPVNRATTHPNIRLVARDADQAMHINSQQSSPVIPEAPLPGLKDSRFSFDDLPREVLFRILQELLWFDGSLVHCFSRLDPYVAPVDFPDAQELGDNQTGIRGRFFISADKRVPLSLTHDTVDPNKILAPLSVCRRWAWYGSHIFYGRNTFAFSSLGEWERFCNGIKAARVQRLQVRYPGILHHNRYLVLTTGLYRTWSSRGLGANACPLTPARKAEHA